MASTPVEEKPRQTSSSVMIPDRRKSMAAPSIMRSGARSCAISTSASSVTAIVSHEPGVKPSTTALRWARTQATGMAAHSVRHRRCLLRGLPVARRACCT